MRRFVSRAWLLVAMLFVLGCADQDFLRFWGQHPDLLSEDGEDVTVGPDVCDLSGRLPSWLHIDLLSSAEAVDPDERFSLFVGDVDGQDNRSSWIIAFYSRALGGDPLRPVVVVSTSPQEEEFGWISRAGSEEHGVSRLEAMPADGEFYNRNYRASAQADCSHLSSDLLTQMAHVDVDSGESFLPERCEASLRIRQRCQVVEAGDDPCYIDRISFDMRVRGEVQQDGEPTDSDVTVPLMHGLVLDQFYGGESVYTQGVAHGVHAWTAADGGPEKVRIQPTSLTQFRDACGFPRAWQHAVYEDAPDGDWGRYVPASPRIVRVGMTR